MKMIQLLLLTTLTLSAFAEGKFFCQEYDRKTEQMLSRSVVLTPIGEATEKLNEDGEYEAMLIPYQIEVFDGLKYFPVISTKGTALTEDVWFDFTSNDNKVGFSMYLDELEESGLSLISDDSQINSDFVCRF